MGSESPQGYCPAIFEEPGYRKRPLCRGTTTTVFVWCKCRDNGRNGSCSKCHIQAKTRNKGMGQPGDWSSEIYTLRRYKMSNTCKDGIIYSFIAAGLVYLAYNVGIIARMMGANSEMGSVVMAIIIIGGAMFVVSEEYEKSNHAV